MSDYQKVEVGGDEPQPYSQEDLIKIQEIEQREQEVETETQESGDEERPGWLPEKFGSPEEMAKAYEELQSQFTKERQGSEEEEETKDSSNVEPLSMDDFSDFTSEFSETGDVSEESREKISSWGIPREMIDGYIEGQKAVLDGHFNAVYSEVGGEENYNQMIEWAGENLAESEIDVFNSQVMNGTSEESMFAIRSLSSRWTMDGGGNTSAPLIQGSTGTTGSSGAFRSLAEMTQAMKDPRYHKDPAYRQDIQNRLSNSNIL